MKVGHIIQGFLQPGSQRCFSWYLWQNLQLMKQNIYTQSQAVKQRAFHRNETMGLCLSGHPGPLALVSLWNYTFPTVEWELLFLGFHEATSVMFRTLICGLYQDWVKAVNPTFGHLLVTITMNTCHHLQTGGWNSKNLLATEMSIQYELCLN